MIQTLATFGIVWQLTPTYGNFWQLLASFGNSDCPVIAQRAQSKVCHHSDLLVNACPRMCDAHPFGNCYSKAKMQYAVAGAVYWKSSAEEKKTFPTASFPTSILQFLLLFWQIDQFCGHNAFSWETNKQGAQHSSDLGCAAPIKAKQMEPRITPILNLIKNSIYFHPILLIWLFYLIELFHSIF